MKTNTYISSTLLAMALMLVPVPTSIAAEDTAPPQNDRESRAKDNSKRKKPRNNRKYSLEQAISDKAQLNTIAFSGLAFITGGFAESTFIPPGKVCDFFGFQYMRDIDLAQKGHNPMFLNRVAGNVLSILTEKQRALLVEHAHQEAPLLEKMALMRLPLIEAFWRNLNGDTPKDKPALNQSAVINYTGKIFKLDAQLSYERAILFTKLAYSLSSEQKEYLGKMKFGDFNSWPDVSSQSFRLPKGTAKLINIAYMTYASEFFSWYAGNTDADIYFCPERHGTYFGGFYLKDMPAMGQRDYDINQALTGDSGATFIELLTPEQRKYMTDILPLQKQPMLDIVKVRRSISQELRKALADTKGQKSDRLPDQEKILAWGQQYGELDGRISYYYDEAFKAIFKTLTAEQKDALMKLRNLDGFTPPKAFLYSAPLDKLPSNINSDVFFSK